MAPTLAELDPVIAELVSLHRQVRFRSISDQGRSEHDIESGARPGTTIEIPTVKRRASGGLLSESLD